MPPRFPAVRALLPLALALAPGCARPPAEPELVLHNGRVFTADADTPWAEAVLVRGERVALVGTSQEVLAAAAPAATRVDLEGRVVIPGLNDAHVHIAPGGPATQVVVSPDPVPDPTLAQVLDSLRAVTARLPAGRWIEVQVSEQVLRHPRARRAALDAAAPGHPVLLKGFTGHGSIFNSAGLAALGIEESVADPLGGRFERDAAGRLTGLVEEYAEFNLIEPLVVGTDSAAVVAAFQDYARNAAGWGVTSLQAFATGTSPATLARVLPALDLPVRLRLIPWPLTTSTGRQEAAWNALTPPAGGRITISGRKYILDGTPVERLAAMRQPYADAPTSGRINLPADTIRAILAEALARHDQPIFHASGDSTIAVLLQAMTELAPDSAWQRLRPRIEHGDGLAPDQVPLAARLGVVLVENPAHFTVMPTLLVRMGPARMAHYQPVRTALEAGMVVALGSDGPPNPFLNIMLATFHPANPGEALSVEQAVRALTIASAWAEHAEGERGGIVAGLQADLAVLSQDIFAIAPDRLPATRSLLTVVGGRVVWDPNGWAAPPR